MTGSTDNRDERIYREAAALWRELRGEQPPVSGDGGAMLDILMRSLPEKSYERLQSPHLRPRSMSQMG